VAVEQLDKHGADEGGMFIHDERPDYRVQLERGGQLRPLSTISASDAAAAGGDVDRDSNCQHYRAASHL